MGFAFAEEIFGIFCFPEQLFHQVDPYTAELLVEKVVVNSSLS